MVPADLVAALGRELGCTVRPAVRRVGGGSIHEAVRVETSRGAVFVKYGPPEVAAQYEAECEGIRALAGAGAVRTPEVLAVTRTAEHAFAAFEWIELSAATPTSDELLGARLAALHSVTADRFGWQRDNFIGATLQRNAWCDDWVTFWQRERLESQLQLARDNGASNRLLEQGARLSERVADFFAGYRPVASLIHGDLWSGNRAADERGQPVIFDPAVYYADREAELAMCELFGGFGSGFERAYERAWPLAAGANARRTLYQLYHVLNHYNLFGGGYHAQAERMIERLLAEARA